MNDNVYSYRGSLYCGGHGDEIRRALHTNVERGTLRCPNFGDSEQWPQPVDPMSVTDADFCDACLQSALEQDWPVSMALLRG